MPNRSAASCLSYWAADMVTIYGLCEPATGELRYVGKANDTAKRLATHMRDCRRRVTPVAKWVASLCAGGMAPTMVVLRQCEAGEDWRLVERQEIAIARAASGRLLNVADGGGEPKCPAGIRAANGRSVAAARASSPKRKRIYDLKREMGRLLREGRVSEEQKAKLRYAAARAPHLFGAWAAL